MIIYHIPVYAYFEDMQGNKPMDYIILCSNTLFHRFNNMSNIPSPYYTNSNEDGINLFEDIKSALGDYLLTRNFSVYCNILGHETEYADWAQSVWKNAFDICGLRCEYFKAGHQGGQSANKIFNVNDNQDLAYPQQCSIGYISSVGTTTATVYVRNIGAATNIGTSTFFLATQHDRSMTIDLQVYPENIFKNGKIDVDNYIHSSYWVPRFRMIIGFDVNCTKVTSLQIYVTHGDWLLANFTEANSGEGAIADGVATQVNDQDNPYGNNGTSMTGGGGGHYGDIDSVDGTPIPSLPTITAADLGFITMYNPTKAQLLSLSNFMWSGLFDLDTYKKLFSDPMQSIIGLSIVPVAPSIAGSKNVMFGAIDSGVSMSYLSTQYVQFDCGSVRIEDYIGSFLDYSPYTKISIYLPYIGIHELNPDDIMNDTINVTYNIDVLSGACGAFISSSKKGVLYSYNGSCISNIPLTSVNFSSAIQNAVSAVCSGAAMIAGMVTEAAPLTAAGAIGLLGNGANAALNSKPSVQRSGSLGGSAGVLSVQKPYLIIERPNLSVPANVQKMVGQTSNITAYLGNLSGFTMVEYVHIEGIPATDEEIQEIEALLKEGVIL